MRPAQDRLREEKRRGLSDLYRELAETESRLQAMETQFGYKHNFNQNQPRNPRGADGAGQWASEGVTEADRKNPRFKGLGPVQIKKQKFVDAHLAAAERGAKTLNVPVENLLGLSALEGGWGKKNNRFAAEGNNFFGLHYPASFSGPPIRARESNARVATFKSYEESMNSFINDYGHLVRGVSDSAAFAHALQDSGKFGVNVDGSKVATYVPKMVNTIHGLLFHIAKTRNH